MAVCSVLSGDDSGPGAADEDEDEAEAEDDARRGLAVPQPRVREHQLCLSR